MTRLDYRKLSPALGVEIRMDLMAELNEETLAEIEALFEEHHLLLFRGQSLSEEAQVRFSRHFGPISRRNPAMRGRETVMVSNRDPNGILGTGELFFHSDNTFFRHPLKAIGLFAIEVPEEGGDTIFSNCRLVYEALPEDLRRRVDGLTSYQLFDYAGDYNRRSSLDAAPADAPRAIHPLVWTEPKSGRKVLFFSEHTAARINELDPAEEDDLIGTLRSYISDPRFCYRHKWRPGDFLFWDNVILQHARTDFDPSKARRLRRTPILDPEGDARFPLSREVAPTHPPA
jgi:taurine dioxygenase